MLFVLFWILFCALIVIIGLALAGFMAFFMFKIFIVLLAAWFICLLLW